MYWASPRQTTRVEDLANCLIGLLKADMPLIYSEKYKAFFGLQTAIMKVMEDHSLFAWEVPDITKDVVSCGLLATWPEVFMGSRK